MGEVVEDTTLELEQMEDRVVVEAVVEVVEQLEE
jgi:hypothetical protein